MIANLQIVPRDVILGVLDTLPISYYLHTDMIKVTLDDHIKESVCDIKNNLIKISTKSIRECIKKTNNPNLELEPVIRTELYHELSHAILTPRELSLYYNYIINIFEDERIESLLRTYYMKVDFRTYIKLQCNYPRFCINSARTPEDAFFCVVRFREGPVEFVNRVHEIIMKYSKFIPRFTVSHIMINGERCLLDIAKDYVREVNELFQDVKEWFEHDKKQENNQNSSSSQGKGTQQKKQSNQTDKEEGSGDGDDSETETLEVRGITDAENEEAFLGSQAVEQFVTEIKEGSSELRNTLESLLERYKNQNKRNGSAIATHHGRLDKRAIQHAQINHDYKYWVTKNRLGNARAFSKIHLNVFCDASGSMRDSEGQVNLILRSLVSLEKEYQEFSFDLIVMSEGEWLTEKDDRVLNISENKYPCGNFLTESIKDIYYQVQRPEANNYNLVLFDGDYIAPPFIKSEHKDKENQEMARANLRVFDNNNTFVIADSNNKAYCEKYLNRTNNYKIISGDYVQELQNAVITTLDTMLR